MSKKPEPADAPAADPTAFDLTLEEFCAGLSARDRRVEMIGGFFADQRRGGPAKASPTVYQEAFDAFCTRPA